MTLPTAVTLVEVGPRDGLQNEPSNLSTSIKIELINRLSKTGLKIIEATSFVSPKWVPQMADHTEVLQGIKRDKGIHYPVLIPNVEGLDNALNANVKDIAVFTAASETFSRKNTNCSINDSLNRIEAIIGKAKQHELRVRGYISCVLGCPYEGDIKPEQVASIATNLFEMGCYEVSLGDTIGIGTPAKAKKLIKHVGHQVPIDNLAVHFHDTYGQALANIYACLELGINTIDCSIGGLGGCPYAPGAGGNVATEDVLFMLNGLGIETGVDLKKLIEVGRFIHQHLQRPTRSKVAMAMQ